MTIDPSALKIMYHSMSENLGSAEFTSSIWSAAQHGLEAYLAALPPPTVAVWKESEGREVYWMAEYPRREAREPPRWWGGLDYGWTYEADLGLHFSRKIDAERFIKGTRFVGGTIATEHVTIGALSAQPTAGWREGIEAAANCTEELARSYPVGDKRALYFDHAKRLRALTPPPPANAGGKL